MKTAQRGGLITYREAMLRERASAIASGVSAKLVDRIIKSLGKNARPEELTDAIYKALARKAKPAPPPKKTPKKVPAIEDELEEEELEDEEEEEDEEELHDSDDDEEGGGEEEDEEKTPFRGKSKRKKAALPSCGILNMQRPDFTPPGFQPTVMRAKPSNRERARAAAAKLLGARPIDVAHWDDTMLLAAAGASLNRSGRR
jgi:hypothetical protein